MLPLRAEERSGTLSRCAELAGTRRGGTNQFYTKREFFFPFLRRWGISASQLGAQGIRHDKSGLLVLYSLHHYWFLFTVYCLYFYCLNFSQIIWVVVIHLSWSLYSFNGCVQQSFSSATQLCSLTLASSLHHNIAMQVMLSVFWQFPQTTAPVLHSSVWLILFCTLEILDMTLIY